MSRYDIANYVVSHLQDPLSRINGVGNFNVFGTQYAMRIWLDTDKLNSFALTPVDVSNAIQNQNVQVAGGQLGGTPAPTTQRLTATITEATLLRTPAEFENILLKVNPDGSQVRIRDVARVELGAETYFIDSRYNGQPSSGIGIQLAPGANALDTATAVRAKIDELKPYFPHGLRGRVPVRHDAVREDFDHRSREDAVRGHPARFPGDVPVPAEPARHAHSDHRGAGRTAWSVRGHGGLRVHDQRAVDVRAGARDRPPGRRRHRGRRERRAGDVRGRSIAARGDAQGHGTDHRRAGRRGRGAERGVRARSLLGRIGRRDLSAVLAHDRVRDAAFGVRRAVADPGALLGDAEAARQRRRGVRERDSLARSIAASSMGATSTSAACGM